MGKYNQSKGACSCVWNMCCLIVYHNVCCADRDRERPLPQPFLLPQNFSADVEAGPKKGSMSVTTMAKFITAVAHGVFAFKRYPSSIDFTLVADQICTKYSFVRDSVGNGHARKVAIFLLYQSYSLVFYVGVPG